MLAILFPSIILCFHFVHSLHLPSHLYLHLNTTLSIPTPSLTKSPSISQLHIIQTIYKTLLTDKSVKKLLDKNDTSSDQFKKLVFQKVRESIRTNLEVLKYLSHRVFQSSNLNLSETQKQELLQAFLNDKELTDLFSQGKEDSEEGKKEIVKKIAEMYRNNPLLMAEVGEKVLEKSGMTITREEKAEIFKILLESEKGVMGEESLSDKDVEKVMESVDKNEKLKSLSKSNKDALKVFLKGI